MSTWTKQKLGDCIRIFNGKSVKAKSVGEYPVYGSNGKIGYCLESIYENAIILGRVGAYCGSVMIESGKFWASDNTIVLRNNNHTSLRFLYFLLKNLDLNQFAGGAAQPLITHALLRQINVSIPALFDQQNIASVLSTYDDLIENNEKRIKILEEMAERLYREWFVKFKFPDHEKVRFIDSGTEYGKVPEGWGVKNTEECFDVLGGGTPSRMNPDFWNNGTVNWYTPTDITRSNQMFLDESSEKISNIGLNKSSAKLFPARSIMMTSRATIGAISINTKTASTNQGFIVCLPNKSVTLYYLFHWLKTKIPSFIELAGGATFKELSKGNFKKIKILIPDKKVLNEFEERTNLVAEQMLASQRMMHNLSKTRDLLIPLLVSEKRELR